MKACLDACVLYPTVMREILMGVAAAGLLTPIWSERICEEWRRAAERRVPGDGVIASGEIAALNAKWPKARCPAAPDLEAQLWLPDAHDIHVLATALSAEADCIITLNLKDFPRRELAVHEVNARHPDEVLYGFWLQSPDQVAQIVSKVHGVAETLSGETIPLRSLLKRARLPRLGKALTSSSL